MFLILQLDWVSTNKSMANIRVISFHFFIYKSLSKPSTNGTITGI